MIGGRDGVLCMSTLLQWHCCPRCALRYIAELNEDLYAKSPQTIHEHIRSLAEKENESTKGSSEDQKEEISVPDYSDDVCVACVGILQAYYCSPDFLDEIVSKKKATGHEVNTFFLPISFPVAMTLRQHALWICLTEKFPDLYQNDMLENIVTVKEVWRWVNLKPLSAALNLKFNKDSRFHITLNFSHKCSQKECNFLYSASPGQFQRRKGRADVFNRSNVRQAIRKMPNDTFKKHYQVPPSVLDTPCDGHNIEYHHDSIYIAGRYNKYSRTLSQTEWVIGGERKTESSIEELIGLPIVTNLKCDRFVFTSSGREDVDVKMLGNGRPFALELVNPRRVAVSQQDITQIQKDINSATKDVSVRHLQVVSKDSLSAIKDGEEDKVKCYSAVCWSQAAVTKQGLDTLASLTDLVLQQKTPVRVLHRRALATRSKTIHSMKAERIDDHHFLLYLNTQAGTYIKEFVHGDMGRTVPNMGSILGTKCDILELNVEAVMLDWPKPVDE